MNTQNSSKPHLCGRQGFTRRIFSSRNDEEDRRGIVKSKLDQPQEAVADFDKAIELNPEYVEAYLRRYTANAKLGKLEEATRDYNRAKELMGISG